MKLWYDLHLHSCLSPCGEAEMTPNNLVNMAKLLGYDVIALTDHNSVGNCGAAVAVGKQAGITVIPGMELCTAEEIHVICLFADLEGAQQFGGMVAQALPPVRNRPKVFGQQVYRNERDEIVGTEEVLLVNASSISVEEVGQLAGGCGGISFPAHIDRASYSILASLGTIPPGLGFGCAEISGQGELYSLMEANPILREMYILQSSDAHRLEDMPDPSRFLEVAENTPQAVIEFLKNTPQQ